MSHDQDETNEIISDALYVRGPIQKNIQVQYIDGSPTEITSFQKVTLTQTNDPKRCRLAPQFWTLEVFCGSLTSLTRAAARQDVPPIGDLLSTNQRCSTGHIILSYDGDVIKFDIGRGGRYSIPSNSASVQAEFPTPLIDIRGGNYSNETKAIGLENVGSGLRMFDTSLLVQFRSNITPIGRGTAFLTESINVTGGDARLVPIPNRAIGVQVYQAPGAVGAPTEMEFSNTITVGGGVAEISFVAQNLGVENQTAKLSIPGNSCFVNTGVQVRNLTFVWELEL